MTSDDEPNPVADGRWVIVGPGAERARIAEARLAAGKIVYHVDGRA